MNPYKPPRTTTNQPNRWAENAVTVLAWFAYVLGLFIAAVGVVLIVADLAFSWM